jgi:aerobic-type carbon monoxide dehydrogenase small subunit (CoxS/CutS family)
MLIGRVLPTSGYPAQRMPPRHIALVVNGRPLELAVAPHHTLLTVLRDQTQLTGTKECCAEGECGACTILLNGRAVNSCLVLAAEADGQEITTVEGLATDGRLSPLQQAFVDHGAVQCGFCIPGMLMAATALLARTPQPTTTEIQAALAGNLCRCAGYSRIIAAVHAAAQASA